MWSEDSSAAMAAPAAPVATMESSPDLPEVIGRPPDGVHDTLQKTLDFLSRWGISAGFVSSPSLSH